MAENRSTVSSRSTSSAAPQKPASTAPQRSSSGAAVSRLQGGSRNGTSGARSRYDSNEVFLDNTSSSAAASLFSSWAAAPTAEAPDYGRHLSVVPFNIQRRDGAQGWGSRWLSDIDTHVPPNFGNLYKDHDPITWAHESTHGINAAVRNLYSDGGRRKVNAFYIGDGRAVVLEEPNIRKSSVNQFIPPSLRTSRSELYVRGMHEWDDRPLYILDEMTAYTNGGLTGTEIAKNGNWRQGGRDGVTGQLEFTAYSFALGMAVEKQDPNYFKNHPEFKEYLAFAGLRAMDGYREGSQLPAFRNAHQEQFFNNFKNSPDAQPMRDFIERNYGKEYLNRLMTGTGPTPGPSPSPTPGPSPSPTPGPSPGPTPGPSPSPGPSPTPGPSPSPGPSPLPPPGPSPGPAPMPPDDGGGCDGGGEGGDEGGLGGFLMKLLQLIFQLLGLG